jgi:hypothetical protein
VGVRSPPVLVCASLFDLVMVVEVASKVGRIRLRDRHEV